MSLISNIRRLLDGPLPTDVDLLHGDAGEHVAQTLGTMPAAVLMAIVDQPDPTLILTRRTASLRRHAGQVSFPGGRIDPDDSDALSAALREADEEIGLPATDVKILGSLSPYTTITGFHVTPFIGLIQPGVKLVPDTNEVARVFEAPLDVMLRSDNHIRHNIIYEGKPRFYYEINWNEERVWGATAAMIVNLGRLLGR